MTDYLQQLKNEVSLGKNVFIAPGAHVFGQVSLADHVSVWFNAVLRGDSDAITVGEDTNIQDACVLHVDPGMPLKIGKACVLGHAALVHGCTIGNNTLIGMRATVMNGAVIGNNCIIGAHALVTEGKIIPNNSLVIGAPAVIKRALLPLEIEAITRNAAHYKSLAMKYLNLPL